MDSVDLPPWAPDARIFVKIHRQALESTYVRYVMYIRKMFVLIVQKNSEISIQPGANEIPNSHKAFFSIKYHW